MNRGKEPAVPNNRQLETPADPVVAAQDLATSYSEVFSALGTSLASITDAPSAQAALPGLEQASRNLDGLGPLVSGLPVAAQDQVKRSLETSKTNLQTQIDRVLAIPGVREILQPILDAIMSKLTALIGR
jgi:hypothetical protein